MDPYSKALKDYSVENTQSELLSNLVILSQKLKAESKDNALDVLKAALLIDPMHADSHDSIGYLYAELSLWEKARHHLEYSLSLKEGNALIFYILGNVCMSSGDVASAANYYERALALRRFPEGLLNLSVAYTKLGDENSRLMSLQSLVSEFSEFPEGYNNLGVYWYRTRNISRAIECFEKALDLNPELGIVKYGLSHALLMNKDYLKGFEYHESRWGNVPNCPIRLIDLPLWQGQDVPNDSILLITLEQGFGDTLQMLRFLPLLREKFSKIIIEVQQPMYRLISNAFPDVQVIVHGSAALPHANFYCPIMTLPWAFRINYDSIPVFPDGYICDNKTEISQLITKTRSRIGLCWRGGSVNPEMLHRSLILSDFTKLINMGEYEWISLVKDLPPNEAAEIANIENITDCSELMSDFCDTYQLIKGLDLVISIDTSVAHLSAAMGKKTIIILNDGVDWRWHLDDEFSAWYPNARLLRTYNFASLDYFMPSLSEEIKNML